MEQVLHTAVVAGSLWLKDHLRVLGSIAAWLFSSAAAQAAVAAAPFPVLRVEAKPPAVAMVASALLAVRQAACRNILEEENDNDCKEQLEDPHGWT